MAAWPQRLGWISPVLELLGHRYFGARLERDWDRRDWSKAAGAALVERLGPAASEAAEHADVVLPREAWLALTAARLRSVRRDEAQRRLLAGLAPLFQDRGLRPVVLKGHAVARYYPEPGVREASDVDLLVAAGWMADVDELLRRSGFRRWPVAMMSNGAAARSVMYVRPDGSDGAAEDLVLDVHPAWQEITLAEDGTTVRVGPSEEAIDVLELGGSRWAALPRAVQLYLIVAHSVLHNPRTLSVYLDVGVLANRGGAEVLEAAAAFARTNGRERHMRHATTSAADLFGFPLDTRYATVPRRLGVPSAVRLGYIAPEFRYLPSAVVLELLWLRGWARKLGFVRWLLGHGHGGGGRASAGRIVWLVQAARGLRWLVGGCLRYRRLPVSALR